MLTFVLIIFSLGWAQALEMSKADFCLSQQEYTSQQNFKIEGTPPPPVLVSTVKRLMDEFSIKGPLVFHFTDHEGPRKVWSLQLSTAKHVYFGKNAVDLLLGLELENIAKEVCRPEWTGTRTYTVVYANTVLEQFLRHTATNESLLQTLKRKTGWDFRSRPGDPHYSNEQDFRTEELVTIVKQLADVPAEVLKLMKIKKLTRYRIGAPLPIKTAKAIYYVEDQTIMFGDGALMDDGTDIFGEGTVLHEMGHAYWYGSTEVMRNEFTAISWLKGKRISDNSVGFISAYSMTSPEEDFAEHFSAYIHQSEFLKRKAMKKYKYFSKNIFSDTTYFSTAAKNAKVWVKSPIPDTKDPILLDLLTKSYKARVLVLDPQTKVADLDVVITGAHDDISGIAPVLLTYEHVQNDNFRIFVNLSPEPGEDGTTRLVGKVRTNPDELAAGQYRANTFNLEDRAGNNQFYKTTDLPLLEIPGNLSLNALDKPALDFSKIKLEMAPVINDHHGVLTSLPIPFKADIETIHLSWEFSDVEGKTTSVCDFDGKESPTNVPCQLHRNSGEEIKIRTYFHKEYPNSKVKLASIHVRYKGTKNSTRASHDYVVPVNTENAAFSLRTGNTSLDLIDLDVNKMKLSTETKLNDEGGDQNVEVLVPLTNHRAGKFYIMGVLRSPTGKQILSIVSESNQKKYTLVTMSGVEYVKFHIELKKNPEEGEYILESFEVHTNYERNRRPYLPLDLNDLATQKIKLLERGIRKTFTITDDRIINLN